MTELLCFHVYTVEIIFPNVLLADLLKDWIAVNLFMDHHHLPSWLFIFCLLFTSICCDYIVWVMIVCSLSS